MTSLKVSISYGDLRAEFEGEPGEVYLNIIKFLEKSIPAYSLAAKLQTSVNVGEVLEKLKDSLGYTQDEGIFVKRPLHTLPTSTSILLYSASRHLNHVLGLSDRPEFLSSELARALNKPEKTISGRLTELVQKNFLKRVGRGGYIITQLGLSHLIESSEAV